MAKVEKFANYILFALRITQPIFLGALVRFFTRIQDTDDSQNNRLEPILFPSIINYIRETFPNYTNNMFEAYLYATFIIVAISLNVMRVHSMNLNQMHLGMKMRVALGSLIYRKSLKLSRTALGETTVGQIVNLLSNDIGRFDSVVLHFHYIYTAPIATLAVTYCLFLGVGFDELRKKLNSTF